MWIFAPFVVFLVLVSVSVLVGDPRLANATVLLAGCWVVGCWLLFGRGWRRVKGVDPSGSDTVSAVEFEKRVAAESSVHPNQPQAGSSTPLIAALLWSQYGHVLLERERQVRSMADRSSWQFEPTDPSTSAVLGRTGLTTFTPSTCRNVCRGVQRDTPFIVTDLTRTRYNLEKADMPHKVDLITATMCIVPFAAPNALRVVARDHWLSDLSKEHEHVSTESGDFNATYRVLGQNTLWTRLVLNPEFMSLILASSVSSLVIDGGRFAVAMEPWEPTSRLTELLDLTRRLHYSALTASAPEQEEPLSYFT